MPGGGGNGGNGPPDKFPIYVQLNDPNPYVNQGRLQGAYETFYETYGVWPNRDVSGVDGWVYLGAYTDYK